MNKAYHIVKRAIAKIKSCKLTKINIKLGIIDLSFAPSLFSWSNHVHN